MPSYSPVFSQGFIYYTEATPNTTFDVPSNFTAVIRQISVWVEAAATDYQVETANGPGAEYVVIDGGVITELLASHHVQGRWVVPGGGSILFNQDTLGVGCQAYVGGYLLRNTLS